MDILALIISFFSLLVAILSALSAHKSATKSTLLANENTGLAHATLDLNMRRAINDAQSAVSELINRIQLRLINRDKNSTLSPEEEKQIKHDELALKTACQSLLNVYDGLCAQYLDGKIDMVRFKKSFSVEIRNLVERDTFQEYFNPATTSPYKPILRVYEEWFNLERN
jgi:hypothetical protein